MSSRKLPGRVVLQHAPLPESFEHLVVDHIRLPPSVDPLTGVTYGHALTKSTDY